MNSPDNANAIAIDGPAGSGKSTISKLLARKLKYTYIDTGAMYRALTLKVMREEVELANEEAIIKVSNDFDFKFVPNETDDAPARVVLDGEDVSEAIRTLEVSANVKHVCKIPEVRENLVNIQKSLARNMAGAVMEGRDIGTVVLPGAKYKFYVDAEFSERVRRRFMELEAKGMSATEDEVADDLRQRDHTDKTREVGPLKQADDAVLVDTTDLTVEEVVDKIISYVKEV